jgi:hypothetical protein
MRQQIQGGTVEPLEIIEKQREWPPTRERGDKAAQYHLEAKLRVVWRKVWHRRLTADDQPERGDQVHHQLTVGAKRLLNGIPPATQVRLALCQDVLDEASERSHECGVGRVALILVELGGREQSARRDERLVELVHHR